MRQPTLVIGHRRDPVHPFNDSDMLVHELPNARLIEANSIMELWTTPERLTGEIVPFIEQCFRGAPAHGSAPAGRHGQARRRSPPGAGPPRRSAARSLRFPAVSSRREQKEALRREREERERQAKAAQARKRMVGYGGGFVLVLAVVAVVVVRARRRRRRRPAAWIRTCSRAEARCRSRRSST